LRRAGGTRFYTSEKDRRPLHPSVSDWQSSARKGCHFCQLVLNGVSALYPQWLKSENGKHILAAAVPYRPLQVLLTDCTSEEPLEHRIEIFVPRETPFSCFQIAFPISLGLSLMHLADCLGTRKTPYWTIGPSTPVIQSSISIYAASLMRYWVEECN